MQKVLLDTTAAATFRQPEFVEGLAAGLVAAGICVLAGLGWRVLRARQAPLGGLAVAGAAGVALTEVVPAPDRVLVGVGLAALGGLLADVGRVPVVVAATAAIPGAWLVATDGTARPAPEIGVLLGICILGGASFAVFERRSSPPSLVPLLAAGAIAGVYATVPDTERALVLLGASLPVAALGWPLGLVRFGAAGSFACTALMAHVAGTDGAPRPGAIVGVAGCLGLVAVAAAAGVAGGAAGSTGSAGWPPPRSVANLVASSLFVLAHALTILYMARLAGFEERLRDAAVLAVIGTCLLVATWVPLRRWGGREPWWPAP